MKTENFIKRYAHTHTEPDQKFCPIFAISWEGHNKELGSYRKYYVPYNGVLTVNEKPEIIKWNPYGYDRYEYCSPSSYGYKGAYAKNIGHDVIEISKIEMIDGSRGRKGEKREWTYERYYTYGWKRLFIDRKTMLPYDEYGNRLWREDDGRFYNRTLIRALNDMASYGRKKPNNLGETLQEFCGCKTAPIGWRNAEVEISTFWNLVEFIKKEKKRPVSDLTAKLLTYELPERSYMGSTIEFDILDDKYAVFRLFQSEETYDISIHRYVSTGTSKEAARIFIDNKGKVSIMENTLNGYRVVGKDLSSIVYFRGEGAQNNINFDKLIEWKPIKWNMEMFDNITYNSFAFLKNLILVLRHPIIEKLYKSGYKELAKQYMRYGNEVISELKETFMLDKINERKGSVYKIFGVNKELLSRVEGVDRYSLRIKEMKQIFGRTDITDLSAETIELYLAGLKNIGWHYWGAIIDMGQWEMRYHPRKLTDEERHLIEKLFRLEMKEPGAVRTYLDAKEIYRRLFNRPEIDFTDFKTLEDITVLHDNLLALERADREERNRLYAMREEERKAEYKKKFDKLQEDRVKKFESHGEKYSIVVPKSLAEITSEGMSLSHCVGSYLESHAQGNTNIVFLRKNDEIDTPFYTIEVNPQNYVVQIHGKHNRWLGNDPDAISFVWKWIKDRGFKCEKYKLLNTGTGYGKGREEVSETYLAA